MFGSSSDFLVCNEVAPSDAQDLSNAFAVKGIWFLFLAGFHVPSFTAVQEGGQCIAVVEPHLCFE